MSEVLAETFERGDQTSIGHALNIPQQHVQEWTVEGARRNPFDAAGVVIETLRTNNNAHADEPFLVLSRRLGFVSYRAGEALDDSRFAAVLDELYNKGLRGASRNALPPWEEYVMADAAKVRRAELGRKSLEKLRAEGRTGTGRKKLVEVTR